MQTSDPIVIVSAKRSPIGCMLGHLSQLSATELGAQTISSALKHAKLTPETIDAVYMGCVLSAGLGQAPARQAALKAGLAHHTPCVTVNKMCGSGLQSIIDACNALYLDQHQVIVAGGMESMSNAPYLVAKGRGGYRLGHGQLLDHLFYDGLEDAYAPGTLMGVFAERTAAEYQLDRKMQDAFAIESLQRAKKAADSGAFSEEIAPVTVQQRKATQLIDEDELPLNAKLDAIPKLKPAFDPNGTVTAANASAISDGAASVILMKRSEAERRGLPVLGVIRAYSTHAQAPEWFTTAPVKAIEKVLARANWDKDSVDIFEINEAFAVVTLAAMQSLALDHSRVNVFGGACALGHPIGASGARIIATLLNIMQQKNARRGLAAICIGGGEALAMAIERD